MTRQYNGPTRLTGYQSPAYTKSLSAYGEPRLLPGSGGWILERQIPGFPYRDAIGPYPLFTCLDWTQLHSDLEELEDELVSLAVVTDPFGDYDVACLRHCFKDTVKPFKLHWVIALPCSLDSISKHHRYYVRKALEVVHVERPDNPGSLLDEWISIYSTLVERHELGGIKSFSREVFAKQLNVPGLVMFRAKHQGQTLGMHLWYVQGSVAYSHLAALSPAGYDTGVSYALHWTAIEYFNDMVDWLNLGAGAGLTTDSDDGLTRFKRGWATETLSAYFCGRIFDDERYAEIENARGTTETSYFPSYRRGEFA